MKHLLTILLLCWSWSAWSQPILRNAATTNSTPKLPNILPTSSNPLFPISVEDPDGSGGDRTISYRPGFFTTGTNMTVPGNLSLNGRTNRLSIANDQLLLDGIPISGGSETAPILNQYISNYFAINGRNNTLIVTQALTLQFIKTNLLSVDANGLVTTTKFGANITWDPATQTLNSTGGGSGLTETVTTLGWSGTNLTGFDCATNGASYYVLLTNHALIGSSTMANLPAKTAYKTYTLCVQNDSTGVWTLTFTNTIFAWSEGSQPVMVTNGSGVAYFYFHTDLTTNSILVGNMNQNVRR